MKTRGPSHGQDRCSSSSRSIPHAHRLWPGPARENTWAASLQSGAAHMEPTSHGPRAGSPTKSRDDGPRPGPAHHISGCSAAARPSHFRNITARPGPAIIFQNSQPGPFSKYSARPRPSQFSDRPGQARPGPLAHDKPRFYLFLMICCFGCW